MSKKPNVPEPPKPIPREVRNDSLASAIVFSIAIGSVLVGLFLSVVLS